MNDAKLWHLSLRIQFIIKPNLPLKPTFKNQPHDKSAYSSSPIDLHAQEVNEVLSHLDFMELLIRSIEVLEKEVLA